MTTAPIITTLKETTTVRANGQETAAPKRDASALPVDVTTLSDSDLAALRAATTTETAARLALAKERVRVLGGGASATGGGDGRHDVKPKYRNPKNPAQTWAGRGGTAPKWYADAIASGVTEAEMRIPEGAV